MTQFSTHDFKFDKFKGFFWKWMWGFHDSQMFTVLFLCCLYTLYVFRILVISNTNGLFQENFSEDLGSEIESQGYQESIEDKIFYILTKILAVAKKNNLLKAY